MDASNTTMAFVVEHKQAVQWPNAHWPCLRELHETVMTSGAAVLRERQTLGASKERPLNVVVWQAVQAPVLRQAQHACAQ
jgi:hypothetical protein